MSASWGAPRKWRRIDRAKAVAQEYRKALLDENPDRCRILDAAMAQVGEGWVVPRIAVAQPEDYVTVLEAAELVERSAQWVYAWVSKDRPNRMRKNGEGRIVVNVGAVQKAAADAPR